MRLENLECIEEQLQSVESAFNDLEDCFYQIRKCIKDEIKIAEKTRKAKQ